MTDKPTPTDTPPPCDQELFDQGVSVGLFDIPKWTAEALCKGIAAATGARVDWHYIGGRVHVKALPAARAPADSVQEDAARVFTYKNQPCNNVTAWRFGEACRAAQPGGDPIDHGLSLLQKLQERGYGIVAIDATRKQGATP